MGILDLEYAQFSSMDLESPERAQDTPMAIGARQFCLCYNFLLHRDIEHAWTCPLRRVLRIVQIMVFPLCGA